jgi:hypothetical protein
MATTGHWIFSVGELRSAPLQAPPSALISTASWRKAQRANARCKQKARGTRAVFFQSASLASEPFFSCLKMRVGFDISDARFGPQARASLSDVGRRDMGTQPEHRGNSEFLLERAAPSAARCPSPVLTSALRRWGSEREDC